MSERKRERGSPLRVQRSQGQMLLVLGLRALRVSETPSKIHSPGKRSACYNVVARRRRESMDSDAKGIGYISASSNGDPENIFEEERSDPGCSSNSSLAEAQLAMRLEEGRVGQASKQASKQGRKGKRGKGDGGGTPLLGVVDRNMHRRLLRQYE
ncbi:hypothetical protein V1478_004840 [Vespula squamosa]|uniref:Uncharacterized protein n=1 Tax=Vespula squamosa TaxID=30214 RepID=A0ABD2BF67_VESSQ